ncbi:MAG: YfhO family protein [Variibacter sp.]
MSRDHVSRDDFCKALCLAVGLTLIKLALFDHAVLTFNAVPNHDSGSAAAAFASSMHALVLENDLAWWLPTPGGGYAQYFNQFLSPLMPTAGSPLFLLWAMAIKSLSLVGIRVPEYLQFLIFQHIVAPTVLFTVFALFVNRFVTSWIAVALAVGAYALGGPGLWNNSWMFCQEWTTIFFGLLAFDLLLDRPTFRRLCLFALAIVVTAMSANYWTVFSQWFLTIAYGSYGLFFFNRVRRLWRRISVAAFWPACWAPYALGAVTLLPVMMWAGFLARIFVEEHGLLTRKGAPFSLHDVYARANESNALHFTVDLFNPVLERALKSYFSINAIHNATYIGVALLPLLVLFFCDRWTRRHSIVAAILVGTLAVRMTNGLFFVLFAVSPLVGALRHIFYFYQYFLQIAVILAAAMALDGVITRRVSERAAAFVLAGWGGIGLSGLVALFVTAGSWPDPALRSIAYATMILCVSVALLWKIRFGHRRWAAVLAGLLCLFQVGDLARYYWEASWIDQDFSLKAWHRTMVDGRMPRADRQRQPWTVPSADKRDGGLYANMPFGSSLWPENIFNPYAFVQNLKPGELETLRPPSLLSIATGSSSSLVPVKAKISRWGYNRLEIDAELSTAGSIAVDQTFDPGWRITIDDQPIAAEPVSKAFLGFKAPAGSHHVVLEFRPLSRFLFWPIVFLSLLCCGVLTVFALGRAPRMARSDA